jgi:hypothetical protein
LIDGDNLYVGVLGDGTVRVLDRNATLSCDAQSCALVAIDQSLPSGFAIDSQALYWTTQLGDGVTPEPAGTLVKLAR